MKSLLFQSQEGIDVDAGIEITIDSFRRGGLRTRAAKEAVANLRSDIRKIPVEFRHISEVLKTTNNNFRELDFQHFVEPRETELTGATFERADMRNAVLDGVHLYRSSFRQCSLKLAS